MEQENVKILPVIMCGGSGTRVWPASRESLPKQFISLIGLHSTFQTAAETLADEVFETPIVLSNAEYRFLVAEQLQNINREARIVLEPVRRDSGPAVAVAAELAAQSGPDTIVAVLAADHVVRDREGFVALCKKAAEAAALGYIVTLGIKPDAPATGYGYIKTGKTVTPDGSVFKVEAFVEKPDAATAEKYVAGNYLWNSGNFFFRADVMQEELRNFEPEMAAAAAEAVAKAKKDLNFLVLDAEAFAKAPKKSIDYAVMERTSKAAVVPADIGWSDVGNWQAVWQLSERDVKGNSIRGRGVVMNASNVHVRSDDHLTTVVGVDDVIVVTTQDAVLVLNAAHGDNVKQLVDRLKIEKHPEALEHKRSYRPWGYYQSVDSGARYQVKRIVVKPGERLSLQKHFHRSEHWIVVKGTAEVTRDNEVHFVHENESIYLPIGCVHRMANPGRIDLELIEVQTGSYLAKTTLSVSRMSITVADARPSPRFAWAYLPPSQPLAPRARARWFRRNGAIFPMTTHCLSAMTQQFSNAYKKAFVIAKHNSGTRALRSRAWKKSRKSATKQMARITFPAATVPRGLILTMKNRVRFPIRSTKIWAS
jgi:mannose-1-phosphate guanylyltransferase/mannose-6-phosphate isomerase